MGGKPRQAKGRREPGRRKRSRKRGPTLVPPTLIIILTIVYTLTLNREHILDTTPWHP